MKKNNRILLKIVAILLCLVLITTCVVSSTLARFVIEKEVGVPIKFKNFGVGVELILSDTLKTAIGGEQALENCTTVNGNSISINIDNLAMHPGIEFETGIQFKLSGSPNTRVKLILDIDIDFDPEQFLVPGEILGKAEDQYVMPIGFEYYLFSNGNDCTYGDFMMEPWLLCGSYPSYINAESIFIYDCLYYYEFDPYGTWRQESQPEMAVTGVKTDSPLDTNLALETVIEAGNDFGFTFYDGSDTVIDEFAFDISWPLKATNLMAGTREQIDAAEAYLCREGNDPTISVSYSIRVEQVNAGSFPVWYS